MSNAGFIALGWIAVVGTIAAYAGSLMRRGRSLSARVPADRRRWSTTPGGRTP